MHVQQKYWPENIWENVFGPFPGSGKVSGGRHRPPKRPKKAKNDLLERQVTLEAPNWLIKLDQGLIWPGHICSNVFGPFPGSGKAFVGRHRPPQWPKMARNGPFAAIKTLEAPKWLIKVGQGSIWTKHISVNGFRLFPGLERLLGRHHRPQK